MPFLFPNKFVKMELWDLGFGENIGNTIQGLENG
jgi:hypothetical protein